MISSPFTDKKIMDLSSAPVKSNFLESAGPHEDSIDLVRDAIAPSYDFQHGRPPAHLSHLTLYGVIGDVSVDYPSSSSKINNSNTINYDSITSPDLENVILEKDRNAYEVSVLVRIDQIMGKHTDTMLHELEGLSTQLSQLESRTHHLESSIDDLNFSVGNYRGTTVGKMKQLENILKEVQSGVEMLRDKHDIMEPRTCKEKPLEKSGDLDVPYPPPPAHQQSHLRASSPVSLGDIILPPPHLSQPQHKYGINIPQLSTIPSQPQPFQGEPSPSQPLNAPSPHIMLLPFQNQQYLSQPHQPFLASSHQPYTCSSPPSPSHYSHGHNEDEMQYISLQPFPSGPGPHHPPLPPRQFFGAPSVYPHDPHSLSGTSGPEYASPVLDPYPLVGQHSRGDATTNEMHHYTPTQGHTRGYPQLPTGRVLQHAISTESEEPKSGGTSSRSPPFDEVVEKVVGMGFSRDQVSTMIRKLTDIGRPVDLNVVLDKLTNRR